MSLVPFDDPAPGHEVVFPRAVDGVRMGVKRPLFGAAKVRAARARLAQTDAWAARVSEDRSIMPRDRLLYRRALREILADPSIPWPTEPAPWDPRRLVGKWLIIQRLEAKGWFATAQAILDLPENAEAKERFYRPGWDNVYFNDPTLLAMLDAVIAIHMPEADEAQRLAERDALVAA